MILNILIAFFCSNAFAHEIQSSPLDKIEVRQDTDLQATYVTIIGHNKGLAEGAVTILLADGARRIENQDASGCRYTSIEFEHDKSQKITITSPQNSCSKPLSYNDKPSVFRWEFEVADFDDLAIGQRASDLAFSGSIAARLYSGLANMRALVVGKTRDNQGAFTVRMYELKTDHFAIRCLKQKNRPACALKLY